MKKRTTDQVTLTGHCMSCNKKIILSTKQIMEGERDGAALSECCFMPIIVDKATFSKPSKKKGG